MKDLEALRDTLDITLLRLESGQALARSLDDAPSFKCDRIWVERWIELRRKLQSGQASSIEGLTNFRRSVDLQLRVRRLVDKRSLLPVLQAASVGLTSLVFLVTTQIFFREIFLLQPPELALSLSLIAAGYYWIWRLLEAYKKELWFIDWLEFLSGLATQLSWGQSLLVAWKNSMPSPQKIPPKLHAFLQESFCHAENYEALPNRKPIDPKDKLLMRSQTRWEQIHRLFVANERVQPVLQKELENSFASFQESLEKKAELLALRLMMPLFMCFAPAYLVMMLTPLIRPFLEQAP